MADAEVHERKELGFSQWQGIPLSVLRNASPEQIQDLLNHHAHHFPRFRGSSGPEVWNTVTWPLHIKKIRTLEWSIARLALELMCHAQESQPSTLNIHSAVTEEVLTQLSIASTSDVHSSLDYAREQLNTLANGKTKSDEFYYHFESPKFPRYSVRQSEDPTFVDQLTANLHSLFESTDRQSAGIISLLPSICFYLLTSNAPPSIHTYNLLISEFAAERQDHFIRFLLASIYRTHVRPNEITLAETLRHYIRIHDRHRFNRHVSRMDGFCEGLGLAHPQMHIPHLLRFQYRVRSTPFTRTGKAAQDQYHELSNLSKSDLVAMRKNGKVKIYEKSRRNLEVYRALIQGSLFFDGLSAAMKHYRFMISEGWEPDEDILCSILHHCVVNGEWEAGIATWMHLQTRDNSVDERIYMLMIQLCHRCNKEELIQEVLQSGILRKVLPPTVLELGCDEFAMLGQAQDPSEKLFIAKDLWVLEQSLEDLLQQSQGVHEGLSDILDRIPLVADQIEKLVQHPSLKTIALLREARILAVTEHKYSNFDSVLRASNDRILCLINELKDIRFSMRMYELEAQLHSIFCAVEDCVGIFQNILLSARVERLEIKLQEMSVRIMQFTRSSKQEMTSLVVQISWARYHAICKRTAIIRHGMSKFVVKFLPSLVSHLGTEMGMLRARIRDTSDELKEVLIHMHGGTVTFRSLGAVGCGFHVQTKPRIPKIRNTYPQPDITDWASPLSVEVDHRVSSVKGRFVPAARSNNPGSIAGRTKFPTEGQGSNALADGEGPRNLKDAQPQPQDQFELSLESNILRSQVQAFGKRVDRLRSHIRTASNVYKKILYLISVNDLCKRMGNLSSDIRATLDELKEVLAVIHGGAVTFKNLGDARWDFCVNSKVALPADNSSVQHLSQRDREAQLSVSTRQVDLGQADLKHTSTRALWLNADGPSAENIRGRKAHNLEDAESQLPSQTNLSFGSHQTHDLLLSPEISLSLNAALVTDYELKLALAAQQDRRSSTHSLDLS